MPVQAAVEILSPVANLPSDAVQPYIVGGESVSSCNFPSCAVMNGDSLCTATLIHPRVVTTAGHCINGLSNTRTQFGFGDDARSQSSTVDGTCKSVGQEPGADWAYCILDEPVTNVPIVPVLMGCEVEALKKGQDILLVGYGNSSMGSGAGPKREVLTPIAANIGQGSTDIEAVYENEILVGHAEKGACGGDSGGPAYIDLRTVPGFKDKKGAGWRVFGITSRKGPGGGRCTSTSVYSLIHTIMPRIEQDLGEDATPCFDADGTWNPSEDCKGFPDPRAGGAWPDCSAGELSGYSHTCGDNEFDKEEDDSGETNPESQGTKSNPTDGDPDSAGTDPDSEDTGSDPETDSESNGSDANTDSDSDSSDSGSDSKESDSDSSSDSGDSGHESEGDSDSDSGDSDSESDDTDLDTERKANKNRDDADGDDDDDQPSKTGCSVQNDAPSQLLGYGAILLGFFSLRRRQGR